VTNCCAGVTCAVGQQCYTQTGSCAPISNYCSASVDCPSGYQCDKEKNLCIAVPAYGPNSGRGCIAGFGQWTWQKDPATGASGWYCQYANECSPVACRRCAQPLGSTARS
jgi:hypothetical protein